MTRETTFIVDKLDRSFEMAEQIYPLPAGQFRSLGGYLDYSDWPDRERFLELDKALRGQGRDEEDIDDALPPSGRSFSQLVEPGDEERPRHWIRFEPGSIDI